jgi:small subunit ribosomal protein S1
MIEVKILSVDKDKKRVSLGIKQLSDDPWKKEIPEKYHVGDIVKGKVTKMTDFGAFIDLSNGLEGLLHISEVSKEKIKNLESVLSIGQDLNVKIVKIEPEARKIGLSLKGVEGAPVPPAQEDNAKEEPAAAAEVEVTENAAPESADAGAPEEAAAEEKTEEVKNEDNA